MFILYMYMYTCMMYHVTSIKYSIYVLITKLYPASIHIHFCMDTQNQWKVLEL